MVWFLKVEPNSAVIAGLDLAISIRGALCLDNRDGRNKSGHDG
jgi:hypothetical protein